MAETLVIDTNLLIVASAADDGSPFRPEATPIHEAALRREVLSWVVDFEADSSCHAVLDWDWHLCGEYQNKLSEQDYGWLALMAKRDRNEVVWVGLSIDTHGHALLPRVLADAVADLADRKMVAAVLAAIAEGHGCQLVNACDTDWLDCGDVLAVNGVTLNHLLHEWLVEKWKAKHTPKQ